MARFRKTTRRTAIIAFALLAACLLAHRLTVAQEGGGDPQARSEAQPSRIILDCDADNTTGEHEDVPYPDTSLGDQGTTERSLKATQPTLAVLNAALDADLVPGFARGLDMFGNTTADSCTRFRHIVLTVAEGVNTSKARITFAYALSAPASMTRSANPDGSYAHTAAAGLLRIWSVDGCESRLKASVANGGNLIVPGEAYTLEQLGITPGAGRVFYVEGVGDTESTQITATLSGDGGAESDFCLVSTVLAQDMNTASCF